MTPDLVASLCRVTLATTFAVAAVPKLRDPRAFAAAVLAYQLLPRRLALAVARVLPPIELLVAANLLANVAPRASAGIAFALLFAFNSAMVIAIRRGQSIDCGCFGRPHRVGWPTLARDTLLMLAAGVVVAA